MDISNLKMFRTETYCNYVDSMKLLYFKVMNRFRTGKFDFKLYKQQINIMEKYVRLQESSENNHLMYLWNSDCGLQNFVLGINVRLKDKVKIVIGPETTARGATRQSLEVIHSDEFLPHQQFTGYTMYECWSDYGAERIIENHELILPIVQDHVRSKLNLCIDVALDEEKYYFFEDKESYFISLKAARYKQTRLKENEDPHKIIINNEDFFKNVINEEANLAYQIQVSDEAAGTSTEEINRSVEVFLNPVFCGTIYVKSDNNYPTMMEIQGTSLKGQTRGAWKKKFMLLRNRKLYFIDSHQTMIEFYHMNKQEFDDLGEFCEKNSHGTEKITFIGTISDFEIFSASRFMQLYGAPFGGGIILRDMKKTEDLRPIKLMFCICPPPESSQIADYPGQTPDLTRYGKLLWLAAFRIAKYGDYIQKDYELFIRLERIYLTLLEYNNPMVPMDFSSGVGKIIKDESEVEKLKRNRILPPLRFQNTIPFSVELSDGPHLRQKYYHGDLSGEEAHKLLKATKNDNVWLLRNSRTRQCLTISYIVSNRIFHKPILAASVMDPATRSNLFVATLDQNIAFYDIQSLINYYRLNKGDKMICILGTPVKNPNQPDRTPPKIGDFSSIARKVTDTLFSKKDQSSASRNVSASSGAIPKIKQFLTKTEESHISNNSSKNSNETLIEDEQSLLTPSDGKEDATEIR